MKQSARSVQEALDATGPVCKVVELPDSTRTSKDAAAAIGCSVSEIAKSIVFRVEETDNAVLVIASGANRVNELNVAAHAGGPIKKATAEFVRSSTGFAIGGVPPCGHATKLKVFIERDLLKPKKVWAAAGTPNAVFRLLPKELVSLVDRTIIDIK